MYVQYDINILAILVLIIVWINNFKNGGGSAVKHWLFRSLIVCNLLMLLIDVAVIVMSGTPGIAVHMILQALKFLFFIIGGLFCFFSAVLYMVGTGKPFAARQLLILSVPFLILFVFLFINYYNEMMFAITKTNAYERRPYFHMISACYYSYILFLIWQVFCDRRRFSARDYYPYLIMPLALVLIGVFQVIFYSEILFVLPCIAAVLLIMHLYVLDEKINLDHLTGLYNRKYLDTYIKDILNLNRLNGQNKNKRMFAALMLDIDQFKAINDTYGHIEGDNAIITAAHVLKKSVRKGDIVSRYGGDEFLIILDQCSPVTPGQVIERIEENLSILNAERKLPYAIAFSIGYRVFSDLEGLSSDKIFSSIDELMYQDKLSKTKTRHAYSQMRFDI